MRIDHEKFVIASDIVLSSIVKIYPDVSGRSLCSMAAYTLRSCMFNNRTLIVVGAGASSECKLPTGFEFKAKIAGLLDIRFPNGFEMKSGDAQVCDALRLFVQNGGSRDINPYLRAGWRIRDAMPQAISIDNFIDSHQGDKKLELCGKLSIVRSILAAEQQSSLYVDRLMDRRHIDYSSLSDTWYSAFMQLLTQNCRIE